MTGTVTAPISEQRPFQLDGDDLHPALENLLSAYFGKTQSIRWLHRRRSEYASSYQIENLEIELENRGRLHLVMKGIGSQSLLEPAFGVRPEFLYRARREVEVYRHLLDPDRFGTAICYGATEWREPDCFWLFLERVAGPLLWQTGEMRVWQQAAEWLAKLHHEYEGPRMERGSLRAELLLRYDEPYYTVWIVRAEQFLCRTGSRGRSAALRRFGRLTARYHQVIQRLLELSRTIIHGEFYPSNVIVRRWAMSRGHRICPIDWELAAIGPREMDVATLTSGKWSETEKDAMLDAYCDASVEARGSAKARSEFKKAVHLCQLHLAVKMLGWARNWSAPEPHAQDWLFEACRLADRLGV